MSEKCMDVQQFIKAVLMIKIIKRKTLNNIVVAVKFAHKFVGGKYDAC